jgi:hypothetical protein
MGHHAYGAAYGMGYGGGAMAQGGGMPYMGHGGMAGGLYGQAHGSGDRVSCTVYVTGVDTQVRAHALCFARAVPPLPR